MKPRMSWIPFASGSFSTTSDRRILVGLRERFIGVDSRHAEQNAKVDSHCSFPCQHGYVTAAGLQSVAVESLKTISEAD